MEDIKKITDQLEYLFANHVITGLRDGTITIQSAKESATKLLGTEPYTSFEDAKIKIHELVSNYPFLDFLNKFIDGYHEELKKYETIEKMRQHMRAGNIDEALQVAKE